ncbi:MAG: carboxypeptidase regulatory-like domain-containing protein [Euryarchaeota archaeon]|nr:carboxypeptidase regulatory-like domain-containing protein [Euryarchaeota archaeon]
MNGSAWGVCLVGVMVVLAGCSGASSQEEAPTSSAPPPAPPPAPTEEFGSISGTVVDEEAAPLVGVTVALVEQNQQTKSDEAGAFVFNELVPGKYKVVTEKLGYESSARSVEVTVGAVASLKLVLTALNLTAEPIVVTLPFQGMIQCSVNWLYPVNPCAGVTGEEKNMFRFEVDKGLKLEESVFELTWSPGTAATGQELELDICEDHASTANGLVCYEADYNEYAEGPPPVVIRLDDLPVKNHPKFATGAGAAFLSAAFQQSFWIYASLCYGEACADDFTGLPKP